MTPEDFKVCVAWDATGCVWVTTSSDVPGLVAEADSLPALRAKLQTLVPEMLEANGCHPPDGGITIELIETAPVER